MDTEFYEISLEAEEVLLDLADPSSDGVVLLVFPAGNSLRKYRSAHFQCVELDESRPDLGWRDPDRPCQGAVIIPPFGLEVRAPDGSDHSIRRWFSEEYLIARTQACLTPGSRLVSFVSTGLLSLAQRKDARKMLLSSGLRLVAQLPNEALFEVDHTASTHLVLMVPGSKPVESVVMLDLSNAAELPEAEDLQACLEGHTPAALGVAPTRVPMSELQRDARLDPAYYDPAYLLLRAPDGYTEKTLGELADIIAGVRVDPSERRSTHAPDHVPYLQVRHMQSDRIADNDPFWISLKTVGVDAPKLAMPGDILVSTGGTTGKVVLVGQDQLRGVLYDTSVRRVRLKNPELAPVVADFLRSDIGQLQFRRLTTGTVIPNLTSAHLSQLRVFMPAAPRPVSAPPGQPQVTPSPAPPELSPSQVYMRTLEGELQNILRQLTEGERPGWKESVADKLRLIATDLVPPSLSARVRQGFPAPLAIAYRRFQMATHNPYEQLDRMINLVEACVYFVFHVLVADYSRADWRRQHPLPKPATEALRPRATFDNRIQFIRSMTDLVRANRLDLFVPKLIDCRIDEFADTFRVTLRNPVAHSAPGSEAYVAKLVQTHMAKLEQMLGELDFLANYSMCRVRGHYYQRGRWHYQCELYRGEEYDVNLQELPLPQGSAERLITAERDHLVLLSAEYEALDLWPYYQLHYSDATCRESHLCYVKHFTANDKTLHGESVRSGIELELAGFDDYFRSATSANPGG